MEIFYNDLFTGFSLETDLTEKKVLNITKKIFFSKFPILPEALNIRQHTFDF